MRRLVINFLVGPGSAKSNMEGFEKLSPIRKYNHYIYYILYQVLKVPLVLGISPSLPATLVVAILSATANALKALSALW